MNNKRPYGGFTLIELLVSVVVLAIGLLGMAGLQTTGLNTNQSAYYRSQATVVINDIIDRMRSNTTGVSSGFYDNINTSNIPDDPNCIDTVNGCDAQNLASYDIREWLKYFVNVNNISDFKPLLPGATGTITRVTGTNIYIATVSWQETDWSPGGTGQKVVDTKSMEIRVNF